MICLELYKIMLKKPLEAYRNMYVNDGLTDSLGTSTCLFLSSPSQSLWLVVFYSVELWLFVAKYEANGMEFTLWDHISMNKDTGKSMTLNELIETIKTQYNCDVDMICKGEALIYSCFSKKVFSWTLMILVGCSSTPSDDASGGCGWRSHEDSSS